MNKIVEFGQKALFYIRVLSGYEERRIRNYKMILDKRLQKARAQQAAQKMIPEQLILSEVRRLVEEMNTLNNSLNQTEKAIDDYFKPLDKEAEKVMHMQLKREENTMTELMNVAHKQAIIEHLRSESTESSPQKDEETAK